MESFSFLFYLLPLLLLPLSLHLLRKPPSEDRKNLPPGSKGWPVIGETLHFALLGPQKFIKDRMQKHSQEIFKTSILGEKMAIFCGAQGNKFLFTNENKLLNSWWPESVLSKALIFAVEGSTEQVSALKRSFHHLIFKPEVLKQYVSVMDAMARRHLDREWKPNSVVKVSPSSKEYTFELACRLFMNIADPSQIKKLSEPFSQVTKGIISVPINLPGTTYNAAMKGARMVREELLRIVEERRKAITTMKEEEATDFLSKMVTMRDEEGELISEMKISNTIIGLLLASYDTTSSAVTAVMNYLAQFPHVYDEVFKEQMEIAKSKGPDDLLTWEDIEKMKYSWNVVRESLRLTPPAHGAFRETTKEFTYAGFTVPKGWKIFWSVHSSHKNPMYFPEPEKFDPSRFEGSGPAPYTFIPFGGGPRMCPGKEYARVQALVFMHNVVRRFKLEKAIPNEKIVFHTSPTPVHGLPVHLHPHQK